MSSSSATHEFVKTNFSLVVPRQVPQSGSRVVVCSVQVFLRVCESELQCRRTLAHCPVCHRRASATSLESRCCVVKCARFERLTNVLKQCVSAGEHHDSDNASVPVCSMTQLKHLASNTREQEDVVASTCWWFPSPKKCRTERDSSHNIGPQTGTSFILYLWRLARTFKTGLSMCPDFCRKHSGKQHPCRHRNKNQGCHNSTVRINTESIFRVT